MDGIRENSTQSLWFSYASCYILKVLSGYQMELEHTSFLSFVYIKKAIGKCRNIL